MAISKSIQCGLLLSACFLTLSACVEQPAINPSIEYNNARSVFTPQTPEGTSCKLQCEQIWAKCIKSTYVCDREGADCITACIDHYKAPPSNVAKPETAAPKNPEANNPPPTKPIVTQQPPEAAPVAQTYPLPDDTKPQESPPEAAKTAPPEQPQTSVVPETPQPAK